MNAHKKRQATLWRGVGLGFLSSLIALLLLSCAGAAVLLLVDRPVAAVPMAALLLSVLSGLLSGFLMRRERGEWIGALIFTCLMLLVGILLTHGKLPVVAALNGISFFLCHLLPKLLPKQKRKKRKRT